MDSNISRSAWCLVAGCFGLFFQGATAAEPTRGDVQPEVTIDATASREPISPFIYAHSMAQYAQTVNVIGCIKATPTDACFAATGLPLMLYRREFGTIPVAVTGDHAALDLDIAAAWTADRQTLTIGVVNPHDRPRTIGLTIKGTTPPAGGKVFTITGSDAMAYNEPGRPPGVSIQEEELPYDGRLRVPALSVRLFRLPVK